MSITHAMFLAWFDPNDWEEWRRLDPDGLQVHYADWLKRAKELEQEFPAQGIQVIRQPMRAAAFATWCRDVNIAPNAQARRRYAAILGERRHRH